MTDAKPQHPEGIDDRIPFYVAFRPGDLRPLHPDSSPTLFPTPYSLLLSSSFASLRLCVRFVVSVVFVTAALAQAADKPYPAMGAPQDPKLPISWNKYRDYAEATRLLEDLQRTFPNLCRLQSLGTSFGGRQMWVLTVTNFQKEGGDKRTAMWIDGGIHANEIQAADVVLYTAWFLAESYGKNAFVTKLLDDRTFYLMPMMSPDSRDAHFHEPNTTHGPRSGQRPVDDDRDGLVDEDGPDDLDKDGHITQMRRKDPNGRYKPHPKYPNFLIQAEPDERGEYSLLGAEGFDNDGDGKVNEDGDGYYDPNRDWGWNWQPSYVQPGAFRYPFSLMENRLVGDFIRVHENISAAQSYHNTAGMILYGPGDAGDRFDSADVELSKTIGSRGEQMIPGYKTLNIATGLYTVYGGEVDWLYAMRGILPFTNELFTPFNFFREPKPTGGFFATQEDMHKFDRLLLFGEGFVPWHEVDHPQYGKIEVGGFKKSWGRQPPTFLLEEECHRNMAFTFYHADQMPKVNVQSFESRELGNGLVQVTATVVNERMIPTRMAWDVNKKITRPDFVTISGPSVSVVASLWSDSPILADATVTKREPAKVRVDRVPGMGAVYVRWVVKGKGPYTVTIDSVKGGVASLTR